MLDFEREYKRKKSERFELMSLDNINSRYNTRLNEQATMYRAGVEMSEGTSELLVSKGLITPADIENHERILNAARRGFNTGRDLTMDFREDFDLEMNEVILRGTSGRYDALSGIRLRGRDWRFEEGEFLNYSDEFHDFITQTNRSFHLMPYYYKFERYKAQAYGWMRNVKYLPPDSSEDAILAYTAMERNKCAVNSLYGLMRFYQLSLTNVSDRTAKLRYAFKPYPVQEYLAYLFDLGMSMLVGKPRQIGVTTFIGAAAALRTAISNNFIFKFTAEDLKTAEGIFTSKIRPFINQFQYRPTLIADSDTEIYFGVKFREKGVRGGAGSAIYVESPSDTFINSSTPDLTILDEIGAMQNLNSIIDNGRPTMFFYNPYTKRLEVARQAIAMGTGGKTNLPMRDEWKAAKEAWADKEYTHIFAPVFIDAFAKPGFNMNFYQAEKKAAYAKNRDESKQIFHQSYPLNEEDMFYSKTDTIIDKDIILDNVERSKHYRPNGRIPEYGYFEPIFDESKPYDEHSDIPFAIKGVRFVPTSGWQDEATSCIIYNRPLKGASNTYFQGSDPVFTTTGHSKFGSAIWDANNPECRIAAVMNWRTTGAEDIRANYLQCLLLGLWYDPKIRNLLEINVGSGYATYAKEKGFGFTLVPSMRLPQSLKVGGSDTGIRKHTNNVRFLMSRLQELLYSYSDSIHAEIFWKQLSTYIRFEYKSGVAGNPNVYYAYKPENKRYDYDDVIDAVLYAYICRVCYEFLTPTVNDGTETESVKRNGRSVVIRNSAGQLVKVAVNSREHKAYMNGKR